MEILILNYALHLELKTCIKLTYMSIRLYYFINSLL